MLSGVIGEYVTGYDEVASIRLKDPTAGEFNLDQAEDPVSTYGRNARVRALLEELFEEAGTRAPAIAPNIARNLQVVFTTTSWGFREILLLVAISRMIDASYQASRAFYACSPRALFEGPIRDVLAARGIPHRKSGPLNIAKAAVGLNGSWAAQRRPPGAAKAVVELIAEIETISPPKLRELTIAICALFLKEASRVVSLTVESRPESDPATLFNLASTLIREAPDSGNTPQRVVGLLLESSHEATGSGIKVSGHNDRASVTSTTSKKPGDISEELPEGGLGRVFEVTVKPFTDARARESYQAIRAFDAEFGNITPEVLVICRPQDAVLASTGAAGSAYLGASECEDLRFHFLDINEWIISTLASMPPTARLAFYERLSRYINHPNTAESAKLVWRRLHEDSGIAS
jgi:hypothetical protein